MAEKVTQSLLSLIPVAVAGGIALRMLDVVPSKAYVADISKMDMNTPIWKKAKSLQELL